MYFKFSSWQISDNHGKKLMLKQKSNLFSIIIPDTILAATAGYKDLSSISLVHSMVSKPK
jgi:hypothetical protein